VSYGEATGPGKTGLEVSTVGMRIVWCLTVTSCLDGGPLFLHGRNSTLEIHGVFISSSLFPLFPSGSGGRGEGGKSLFLTHCEFGTSGAERSVCLPDGYAYDLVIRLHARVLSSEV
jgi:hypothetical protein